MFLSRAPLKDGAAVMVWGGSARGSSRDPKPVVRPHRVTGTGPGSAGLGIHHRRGAGSFPWGTDLPGETKPRDDGSDDGFGPITRGGCGITGRGAELLEPGGAPAHRPASAPWHTSRSQRPSVPPKRHVEPPRPASIIIRCRGARTEGPGGATRKAGGQGSIRGPACLKVS